MSFSIRCLLLMSAAGSIVKVIDSLAGLGVDTPLRVNTVAVGYPANFDHLVGHPSVRHEPSLTWYPATREAREKHWHDVTDLIVPPLNSAAPAEVVTGLQWSINQTAVDTSLTADSLAEAEEFPAGPQGYPAVAGDASDLYRDTSDPFQAEDVEEVYDPFISETDDASTALGSEADTPSEVDTPEAPDYDLAGSEEEPFTNFSEVYDRGLLTINRASENKNFKLDTLIRSSAPDSKKGGMILHSIASAINQIGRPLSVGQRTKRPAPIALPSGTATQTAITEAHIETETTSIETDTTRTETETLFTDSETANVLIPPDTTEAHVVSATPAPETTVDAGAEGSVHAEAALDYLVHGRRDFGISEDLRSDLDLKELPASDPAEPGDTEPGDADPSDVGSPGLSLNTEMRPKYAFTCCLGTRGLRGSDHSGSTILILPVLVLLFIPLLLFI